MTNEEKRWQIKQAIAADPQGSNRKIAKKLGRSHTTVAAPRADMAEAVPNGQPGQTEHKPSARAEAALRDDPTLSTRELQEKANVGASTAAKARAEGPKKPGRKAMWEMEPSERKEAQAARKAAKDAKEEADPWNHQLHISRFIKCR